ncbi:hypothetical protein CEXT_449731 [Caerostris extrusa]|uniref:Transmembrane protein n=1 Tax=Caerostris extrusa TaxID=172846 RepID=A0AAV4U8F2_CAEEX|nr:hypothetical protein CEXT_449731 [Caerostris extrusa]
MCFILFHKRKILFHFFTLHETHAINNNNEGKRKRGCLKRRNDKRCGEKFILKSASGRLASSIITLLFFFFLTATVWVFPHNKLERVSFSEEKTSLCTPPHANTCGEERNSSGREGFKFSRLSLEGG